MVKVHAAVFQDCEGNLVKVKVVYTCDNIKEADWLKEHVEPDNDKIEVNIVPRIIVY